MGMTKVSDYLERKFLLLSGLLIFHPSREVTWLILVPKSWMYAHTLGENGGKEGAWQTFVAIFSCITIPNEALTCPHREIFLRLSLSEEQVMKHLYNQGFREDVRSNRWIMKNNHDKTFRDMFNIILGTTRKCNVIFFSKWCPEKAKRLTNIIRNFSLEKKKLLEKFN